MIKKDSIETLLSLAKIEEVIGEVINLTRKGQNYTACCPFHNERTPSFVVSPHRNIYKCFGCGKGGGLLSFVMEYERLNYVEALHYLAARYNFKLEEQKSTDTDTLEEQKRESLRVILEFAKDFFLSIGKRSSIMQNYWEARGFGPAMIEKFQLGYADASPNSLVEALYKGQYNLELARECGLIQMRAGNYFDTYINRIIFPIWDAFGRVVAFAARVLGTENPKYINSPEHELYVKGRTLYALALARKAIIKQNNCYIVEGYTDAMRLHEKGIENVVASAGTALGIEQIKLLKRQTKTSKITILYDADQAGLQNTSRIFALGIQAGLDVYAIKWENYESKQDPDSFFQNYSQVEIENFLQENSIDFVDFRYQIASKIYDLDKDITQKHQLLQQILADLVQFPITYRTKKALYIQKVSQLFGISLSDLESSMPTSNPKYTYNTTNRQISPQKTNIPRALNKNIDPLTCSEEDILRLLWQYPDEKWADGYLRDYILENYQDEFSDPACVAMLQIYQEEYKHKDIVPKVDLFLGHTDPKLRGLMERLLDRIMLREVGISEDMGGGGNAELLQEHLAKKRQNDIRETLDLHIVRILRKAEKANIIAAMNCPIEQREQLNIQRKIIISQIEQIKNRSNTIFID